MTTRRGLIAVALVALPFPALASGDPVAAAIAEVTHGREPTKGAWRSPLPPLAENGGQVPVTVTVESPQTTSLHVCAIHLVAARNPTPGITTFRLSPAVARGEVTTRIRLAEDQTIIAIAELSDGTLRAATAAIRVATGGCLG
ncbi:thiosulfate oxidation carrier protein SoxY [Elioraea tepida]|uniref:Thiosulfate oxidation carrier protein SoxY n=1 Tax=Elioraea tepida TaxID=2843330 RepID=A0A975U092_9PROT|nr:thiosulfate oxidation carrier protein SoxY [Elioraea tepida]QXM23864.1 thiosulfate oxidation carrier protein SoxY [Elioraea tepida]